MSIPSKSKRLFTVARLQGMLSIVIDSNGMAKPSSFWLIYSIICGLIVTITLQWALYKLFTRLYSNTKQEIVQTILVTSKYLLLEWKIIFGYSCQLIQRKDIADVLNKAIKIENYFRKIRFNVQDNEYRFWCSAKRSSNWYQIMSICSAFLIGCLLYTENVLFGDIVVFIVTTYSQIMPTILSSMYFFYLSQSFKFYRILNREMYFVQSRDCCYHRIDEINFLSCVVNEYTECVCKVFSSQILATLFYASVLILVEVSGGKR